MSEELPTIDEKVTIHSRASEGRYYLSAYRSEGENIAKDSWPMDEYGNLIKRLWKNYLSTDERPKLLGQTLTDEGFVIETLHYIAPGVFFDQLGPTLGRKRESLLYWLKLRSEKIRSKIGWRLSDGLDMNLEHILRTHLERKEGALKR